MKPKLNRDLSHYYKCSGITPAIHCKKPGENPRLDVKFNRRNIHTVVTTTQMDISSSATFGAIDANADKSSFRAQRSNEAPYTWSDVRDQKSNYKQQAKIWTTQSTAPSPSHNFPISIEALIG